MCSTSPQCHFIGKHDASLSDPPLLNTRKRKEKNFFVFTNFPKKFFFCWVSWRPLSIRPSIYVCVVFLQHQSIVHLHECILAKSRIVMLCFVEYRKTVFVPQIFTWHVFPSMAFTHKNKALFTCCSYLRKFCYQQTLVFIFSRHTLHNDHTQFKQTSTSSLVIVDGIVADMDVVATAMLKCWTK